MLCPQALTMWVWGQRSQTKAGRAWQAPRELLDSFERTPLILLGKMQGKRMSPPNFGDGGLRETKVPWRGPRTLPQAPPLAGPDPTAWTRTLQVL
jgi:hypothetical protein